MDTTATPTDFSLLGGPLFRLGCGLGLVRGGTNTVALGLALGALLWIVPVALTIAVGAADRVLSLSVIGAHVRLLVAIPLFFVCETWLASRSAAFVGMIVRSGVVPAGELPALQSAIADTARRKDCWQAEATCLLVAAALTQMGPLLQVSGTTAGFDPSRMAADGVTAGAWAWTFCLMLFRFLLLRWLWHLALWTYFLWRVARLRLDLVPTHPDGAAGLGYLEVVHMQLTPLALALSAVQAASLAEEMVAGTAAFEAVYPALALVLAVDAVLFLGPLFIFTPKLWICRMNGLSTYMAFAADYVSRFDRKWLGADGSAGEPLLGTPDLQSLADLSNSVNIVRNMRVVPLSLRMLTAFGIAALLPFMPLYLFQYPVAELSQKFFTRLVGL